MTAATARRRVAAIDCGTNSTRLLVAEAEGNGARPRLHTCERLMRITRLGQGVDRSGELASEAIDRTIAVLREFHDVIEHLGVQRDVAYIRMTATSAARDAANRATFFDGAERVVGVRPELLDGAAEGRLSFLGATAELDPGDGPFLVADIGGGSTELVTGELDQRGIAHVLADRSVDIGCVRISEQHLHSDPPKAAEIAAARTDIRESLKPALEAMAGMRAARTVIGLAGTVSTVASIELGLAAYDRDRVHHHLLSRAAAEEVCGRLAALPLAQRRHVAGLEEGRADVIVGGCLVLSELYDAIDVDTLLVSEADILDGLALSLL